MVREWCFRIGAVLTLAAVLLIGFLGYFRMSPGAFAASPASAIPIVPERDEWFDPETVRPGDLVAGMKAEHVAAGTHGANSVSVLFRGAKEVSGRFEVLSRDTSAYNPGDVIFTADDKSASGLPNAKTFHEVPNRFALRFTNDQDRAKFGVPGSTGTGSIAISDYTAVYADILEGVSDVATVADVRALRVVSPIPPEENNPDFDKEIEPFPAFQLEPKKAAEHAADIYAWIEGVDRTFYGLAYNGKPISGSQRDRIRLWLQEAFTADKAEQLLKSHVPESDGGYLIVGGSSGLIPPVVVKEVRDPQLTPLPDGQYEFTITLIVSGTQDAKLTCSLTYGKTGWKIGDFGYEFV